MNNDQPTTAGLLTFIGIVTVLVVILAKVAVGP